MGETEGLGIDVSESSELADVHKQQVLNLMNDECFLYLNDALSIRSIKFDIKLIMTLNHAHMFVNYISRDVWDLTLVQDAVMKPNCHVFRKRHNCLSQLLSLNVSSFQQFGSSRACQGLSGSFEEVGR